MGAGQLTFLSWCCLAQLPGQVLNTYSSEDKSKFVLSVNKNQFIRWSLQDFSQSSAGFSDFVLVRTNATMVRL
jgi:hypothetical protein